MPRPRKADQLIPPFDLDSCPDRIVHVEAVRAARASLPDGGVLGNLADFFAALSDPTRLRIVAALAHQELCVCDVAATVGISESAISHQLRTLRQLGLVRTRREGRRVYYALDDDHVSDLYRQGVEHVAHRDEGRKN